MWPRPIDALRRGLRLCAGERRVAVRAALLLMIVPVMVKGRGLPRALRVRRGRPSTVSAERVCDLVDGVAAMMPWTPSCLTRSVVAARLIAASGGTSVLVIGVECAGAPFRAHAWIEIDGRCREAVRGWTEVGRWRVDGLRVA